jgi:DNA replication protein DnaC
LDGLANDPLPALRGGDPHRFGECRFLVLDDLGAERGTDFDLDCVCQLLSRRYESWQRSRTVITTNWDAAELRSSSAPGGATACGRSPR